MLFSTLQRFSFEAKLLGEFAAGATREREQQSGSLDWLNTPQHYASRDGVSGNPTFLMGCALEVGGVASDCAEFCSEGTMCEYCCCPCHDIRSSCVQFPSCGFASYSWHGT